MMSDSPAMLRELDKRHLWHPFTQMQDWMASGDDPLILASGLGATLTDVEGRTYFDGNSSIWTNIHGHRHPVIDRAVREQLERLAHCSALGFSNEPSIRLAAALVGWFPADTLTRVFFSDDGSTAIECACRMASQYRELTQEPHRSEIVAFTGAYHGDTVGAASLGGIGTFHDRFHSLGYPVRRISVYEELEQLSATEAGRVNAVIVEPLVQGAAGIRVWPEGLLRQLRQWCDAHGAFLILDEVLTGFGRTGTMFACEQESVVPDFLCLAKGLTGGYMPLAATLTTERVFAAFLGTFAEQKTFFYGHSYCANPLACAAALGSWEVFQSEGVLDALPAKISHLRQLLDAAVEESPHFGECRQVGLIAGVDLVDRRTGGPLDWKAQSGARVCKAARQYGLLTRPIRDTLTLLPPLCASEEELSAAVQALVAAAADVLD